MGIAEAIKNAVAGLLNLAETALAGDFGSIISDAANLVLITPHPLDSSTPLWAFSPPSGGGLWSALWPLYQDVQYITIALWVLMLGMVLTAGTFRNSAKTRKAIRRLVLYLPIAYWWWWIGGWFLKFNQVLTEALIGGSYLTGLSGFLSIGVGSVLLAVAAYVFGAGVAVAMAVVYLARWLVIHIYHIAMPILFMLRCVPQKQVQGFANSLISKYPPIVLTTVPVAILFRVGVEVLSAPSSTVLVGLMQPLFAVVTLLLAAVLPKFVFQFSGQIQSAVSSGAKAASGAAKQTAASAGGGSAGSTPQHTLASGQATGSAGGGAAGAASTTGSSTANQTGSGGGDQYMHDPDLNFSSAEERRGANAAAAAFSAGSTAKSASKKAGEKTASGSLSALGGAAKAVEKGKQSDANTAVAAGGAATKQAWQSASEKASSAASTATEKAAQASDRVKSAREERIDRRLGNAKETVSNTVQQAREETGYTDVFDRDEEPAVSDEYDESAWDAYDSINTAEGEPAMDTSPTGGAAVDPDEGRSEPTATSTITAQTMVDSAGGTYQVDEQQAEQAAANIATDTELWNVGRENQDEPIYDELGIDTDSTPEGAEYRAVQATRHKLYEQADNKGEIPYSDRNSPESNDYTFASNDTEETQSTEGGTISTPSTGNQNSEVGSVEANQTYERNSSDQSVGSFGGSDSGSETTTEKDAGLSPAEQAVQEHVDTRGKSIDDVRGPELAGKIISDDRISTPSEAVDAVESLRSD
jgi:hypothetical protein